MATSTDLGTQVLQELGIIGAVDTVSAEDAALISTRYQQRLVGLVDDNYADWDADSIPDQAMPGLVRVIAYEVGPAFGAERATLMEKSGETWEDRGLAMLRRYMRKKASYEATPADYF